MCLEIADFCKYEQGGGHSKYEYSCIFKLSDFLAAICGLRIQGEVDAEGD